MLVYKWLLLKCCFFLKMNISLYYQLWIQTQGEQKMLKQTELKEKMNKMFGNYAASKCWKNVRVVINENNDEQEDGEDAEDEE